MRDGRMWILDVTVTTPGKVLQELSDSEDHKEPGPAPS